MHRDITVEIGRTGETFLHAERALRCVQRARGLMVVLAGLGVAGLGYSVVMVDDFPFRMRAFFDHPVVYACLVLGIASLLAYGRFLFLGLGYRKRLEQWPGNYGTELAETLKYTGISSPGPRMSLRRVDREIAGLRRDQTCLLRWIWRMAFLAIFSALGFGYAVLLWRSHTPILGEWFSDTLFRLSLVLGVASVVCLAGLLVLILVDWRKLHLRQHYADSLRTGEVGSRAPVVDKMPWPILPNITKINPQTV